MHHTFILSELKKIAGKRGTSQSSSDSYISSGHVYYDISVPERRRISKEWLKANGKIFAADFLKTLDFLYKGPSHDEKTVASILLGLSPEFRKKVTVKKLDQWLGHLVGWAEIDTLCQNVFTANEVLGNWKGPQGWEAFLRKLSKDKNMNKRRASIVFLVGPVGYSSDKRPVKLGFELVDKLKHEKHILITKAISWLLRSMVKLHKADVAAYVEKNKESLPKIAVRETLVKIKTGRKNPARPGK